MKLFKVIIGLFVALFYFLPKAIYLNLLIAYYTFFNYKENLTADPNVHLKRAKKLLKNARNHLLLYAALEIRFALERIVHNELIFSEKASNHALDMYDPSKKRKIMSTIDDNVNYPHEIYFVDKKTNERIYWGMYKPLPQEKVNNIKGRLGDLLHAREGIKLGISNDNWYIQTRKFLYDSLETLTSHLKSNEKYFKYAELNHFEMEKLPYYNSN
ncbi:MAG: hypothetical protein WC644_01210 [Ignavibacteria bacterium]